MTIPDSTTGFTPHNPYAKEAEERWGNTDAYKESQKRVAKMSKEDFERIGQEGDILMKKIVAVSHRDPTNPEVQELIAQHFANLRHFYEPNLEMYRGLGSMYADDPRFRAFYDKYKPDLADFMRDAMHAYCDAGEAK